MTGLKPLILISAGILILAAVLRLVNLNSLPIFADESIYLRWAQIMRAEPSLRFLPLSDGKQPLYMWAVIPFFKVITDPLLAGRIFSALIGLVTTVGVGFGAFLLFSSKRLALLSSLLWAILPFAVFFDRMALVDGLLTALLVWAFDFTYLALTKNRLDLAMFAGYCLGFAWLTKSSALFGLLLLPFLLIIVPRKKILPGIGLLLASYIIAVAMYNVLRLGQEFPMIAMRNKDYIYSLPELLHHPLDPLIPHLRDSAQFYLYLAGPLSLLFIFLGLVLAGRVHWRARFILAVWLIGPVLIQAATAKTLTARYLLFTVPFAAILMAHAVDQIGQKTRRHFLSYFAASLIAFPAIVSVTLLIFNPQSLPLPRIERAGYLEQWTAGYGLREVSGYLKKASSNGPVLVGSEGYFGTPFDALGLYLNNNKNIRVIGVGVWIDSVSDKLTSALKDNQVYLVVNSSRFHNPDPAKLGLSLIASYPKAVPPGGDREFLLFFKVNPVK